MNSIKPKQGDERLTLSAGGQVGALLGGFAARRHSIFCGLPPSLYIFCYKI